MKTKKRKPREWWVLVDPNEPTSEAAFLYNRRENAVMDAAKFWRVCSRPRGSPQAKKGKKR